MHQPLSKALTRVQHEQTRAPGGAEREALGFDVQLPVAAAEIGRLQRTVGNAAVQRLIEQIRPDSRAVQRQPTVTLDAPGRVPTELLSSINIRAASDDELRRRYDLIGATLARFSTSTPETAAIQQDSENISRELARRRALASGRTFSDEAIERMKTYLVANARSSSPESCIVCLNKAVKLLLNDPKQKTTPESIEKTMEKIQAAGRAGETRVIEFKDKKGRITTGSRYPHQLNESIAAAVRDMAGGDVGWSVFGLSLMDGNHSVTLTLDNNDPGSPRFYWSDQWQAKGG